MENATLSPPDTAATPTLRQQIDGLPAYIVRAWRSRYANEGADLEARSIIDRTANDIRTKWELADALAVWVRLADAAGRMRDVSPAHLGAAALAGLAAGVRTQGFREVPSEANPTL
jgi:hypothetical protein